MAQPTAASDHDEPTVGAVPDASSPAGAAGPRPQTTTFGPPSRRSRAMARALALTWRPLMGAWPITPRGVRLARRVTDPGRRGRTVPGTEVRRVRVAGRPAEWVTAPRAADAAGDGAAPARAVLYLHGGGYLIGSPATHRGLVSAVSQVTATPALALDYRLPPDAMVPAPLEDALRAYVHLLDAGVPAERIVVAGDSAGGGLALLCALELVHLGLPVPAGLVLLSPWTDLAVTGGSARESATDVLIPRRALHEAARVVVGPHDPRDPRISPLYAPAERYAGLPPTLVQVGTGELLLDDARRAAARIADAGVPVRLQLWEDQTHVVPMWAGTPEARRALRGLGRFVRERLEVPGPAEPSEGSVRAAAHAGAADAVPPA